ncbi:025L [Cherax quadricarinatus iridovirus]|uniref:MSV199 domain-containing protein n=1 Tax=Shrimp hemocyte iridescent virus TaxID=2039780 RepID=A0A291B0X3_9VIRU|nr:025L [Cherax quadricarinatus iridovirus]YP_010084877.1 hypothetical protein KM509_gp125 [Shrimp hemocyte iridescent virus]UPA43345.1 hypothetical protein 4TH000071 [Iridovirus CN01]ASZ85005.1 025L [Cherax quadricarinatus iridovirus]ATE87134.1 hypothetical protein [Shrimp hemocyte iridescent virus]UPA43580.1 hypothetical protein 3TG000147 [Iridovirus CN01]UPA43615.1 hypothetical protein 1DG000023 [Iridovirus CN01]
MAEQIMYVNENIKFSETRLALGSSDDELLDIFKYIETVKFEIDTFMLDKFWQCVSEDHRIHVDTMVITWLGYDNKEPRLNKQSFIKLLTSHQIEFTRIKHEDPNFSKYPELVEEAKKYSKAVLKNKSWIIMNSDDFKMMVMCLQTKKAMDIRKYYLSIEKLFKMYCEYTLHFNLRREERRLKENLLREERRLKEKDTVIGEKECTIEALRRDIQEAERKREREREEDNRKWEEAKRRQDQLLGISLESKNELKGVKAELGQANENLENVNVQLGQANENLENVNVQLGQANGKLEVANGKLDDANEQLEVMEERMGVMEEHIEEIRDVAVPKPRNKGKIHKIGLVKMSKNYVPDSSDPGYIRNSNVIIIRRQKDSFNVRVQQIKSYGNETNANARVIFEIDNPNSINLFNRLKEKRDPKLGFNGICGIRYLNGCTDEHLLQLISEIHDVRMEM